MTPFTSVPVRHRCTSRLIQPLGKGFCALPYCLSLERALRCGQSPLSAPMHPLSWAESNLQVDLLIQAAISDQAGQKHGICWLRPSCLVSACSASAAQKAADLNLSWWCEHKVCITTHRPTPPVGQAALGQVLLHRNVPVARGAASLRWRPSARQMTLWKTLGTHQGRGEKRLWSSTADKVHQRPALRLTSL